MAMGGPDCLENVEPFLLDVRGGRPTPPELIAEIQARYRATGEKSPAVGMTMNVARKLESRLHASGHGRYKVYAGFRHWHPFIKDTLAKVLLDDPEHIIGFCMAPQQSSLSTGAYRKKVEEAQALMNDHRVVSYIGSWNRHPKLIAGIVVLAKSHVAQSQFCLCFGYFLLIFSILENREAFTKEVFRLLLCICDPAA